MAQALYSSISTGSAVYPCHTQLGNVSIICNGSKSRTMIHAMDGAITGNSLTVGTDTAIWKEGGTSNKITAFNANTDYASIDYLASVDYSSFTGFEVWVRSNHQDGMLRLTFVDSSTYTASVDFRTVQLYRPGALPDSPMKAKYWTRKRVLVSEFKLSNTSFNWAAIDHIYFYTREVTNTTQYNVDALYGVGAPNLKLWWDGAAMQSYPLRLGYPPTGPAATAAAQGAAGNVDVGTHHYRICYVNKELNPEQRGPLSEYFSVTVTSSAKQVGLSNIPDPPTSSDCTHIQIFRTDISGAAFIGPYYYLDEIAQGTTTYTDNISDATLQGHEQLSDRYVQFGSEVPDVEVCVACANRVFYLRDPNNPHRVRWSEYGKPCEMYGDNYFDLDMDGNDEVTGGLNLNNVLYVTTNRGVWRVSNLYADPALWGFDDLETGVGCAGQRTIQVIGLGVENTPIACWLSDFPLNVYSFDGSICRPIGDPILPKLRDMDATLRPYCPSAIDGENQRYVLGIASSTLTDAWDNAYAYDFQLLRKTKRHTWLPFDWRNFTALGVTATGGESFLFDGSESGFVWEHRASTKSDVPQEFHAQGTWSTGAMTVKSISGSTFTLNAQGAFSATSNILAGCYIYCSAGTGAGSWGEITASTWTSGVDIALTIPSWSGTTPIVGDTFILGPIGWYKKTKIHDFGVETQFITLHLYFKTTATTSYTVYWYVDRSESELDSATIVPTETEMDVGIPCHARQIQFKFEAYENNPTINLVGYSLSYISRSEHE